jgi:hypothetical protein
MKIVLDKKENQKTNLLINKYIETQIRYIK